MVTEDYVSYEVAKLLKEKGFYGGCFSMYVTPNPHHGMGNPNEPKIAPHGRDSHYYEGYLYQCEAPTHQMACKWLREVHNIMIEIYLPHEYKNEDEELWNGTYCYELYSLKTGHSMYWDEKEFNSYESACEAALKYTLENLI